MALFIVDCNRWHGIADWRAYAGFSPAVIVKWTDGASKPSQVAVAQRAGAHHAGLRAVGLYHFWRGDISAAAQAAAFISSVGKLATGEWAILDVETARWNAAHEDFARRVDKALGGHCWAYGGQSIGPGVKDRTLWVARYPKGEGAPWHPGEPVFAGNPEIKHALWQFTDTAVGVPGQGDHCDISYFPGHLADLLRLIGAAPAPAPHPAPAPTPTPEDPDMAHLVTADGHAIHLVTGDSIRHVTDPEELAAERAALVVGAKVTRVSAEHLAALYRARGVTP